MFGDNCTTLDNCSKNVSWWRESTLNSQHSQTGSTNIFQYVLDSYEIFLKWQVYWTFNITQSTCVWRKSIFLCVFSPRFSMRFSVFLWLSLGGWIARVTYNLEVPVGQFFATHVKFILFSHGLDIIFGRIVPLWNFWRHTSCSGSWVFLASVSTGGRELVRFEEWRSICEMWIINEILIV